MVVAKKDFIEIHGAQASWKLKQLTSKLVDGLKSLKLLKKDTQIILSVSCVDAAQMTAYNFKYRKKRKPTDVLSFEQPKPSKNSPVHMLGDIVLCTAVVKAQAKEQGHSLKTELSVLMAHGLLHLLGYDHEKSPKEALKMAKLEEALLNESGLVRPAKGARSKAGAVRKSSSGLIGRNQGMR